MIRRSVSGPWSDDLVDVPARQNSVVYRDMTRASPGTYPAESNSFLSAIYARPQTAA